MAKKKLTRQEAEKKYIDSMDRDQKEDTLLNDTLNDLKLDENNNVLLDTNNKETTQDITQSLENTILEVSNVIDNVIDNDIDNDNVKVFTKHQTAALYAAEMKFTAYDILCDDLDSWDDVGPEYDSAGFTEDDRIVNGQYRNI